MNQVGKRVRQRRDQMEMVQDALCARLALATDGVWNPHRRDIGKIETGLRIVSDLEVYALAKALECDPTWLFAGTSGAQPGL